MARILKLVCSPRIDDPTGMSTADFPPELRMKNRVALLLNIGAEVLWSALHTSHSSSWIGLPCSFHLPFLPSPLFIHTTCNAVVSSSSSTSPAPISSGCDAVPLTLSLSGGLLY